MQFSFFTLFAVIVLSAVRAGAGALPPQLYPLAVLSDNPTAYWRLDEANGNAAHDQVGGHDCFLTNVQLNAIGYDLADSDTAAIFGVLATSNSFAGELDKSGVGIANLDFSRPAGSNAEFSVEAWVRGNPQTLNAGIVVKGYGNGGEQFNLDTGSDNVAVHGFRFTIHDAGGTNHSAAAAVTPDGQWHYLVGVCDEPQGMVRLYIDGVDSADANNVSGAGVLTTSNGAAPGGVLASIGSKTSGQSATSFADQFIGTIDEVAVYGYALNAAQVMAHYQAGLAALRFTNTVLRGTNFTLRGSGGLSNSICTLVASTNLTLPLTDWLSLATNVCDASGHFTFTNQITASIPRQFYAVQTVPASAAVWIPPEGAWLGAEVTNNVSGISKMQAISNHEAQIGRTLDILRDYHPPGGWTGLTSDELSFINGGRKLLVSFKPDNYWSNAVGVANGGNTVVDANLASLATSIASVKPRKIMVCVWHEPENDVNVAGTTNQYVAMWHNVRSIFDANGATNVIWCWIVINSGPNFRALIPNLWPGNAFVDWIGWDVYQPTNNIDYVARQADAYNFFVNNSDSDHAYTSKPWAWTEWGVGSQGWVPTAADQTNAFNAVNAALNARLFPRIRFIGYFDDTNAGGGSTDSAILPGA